MNSDRYNLRGVSSKKEDVHAAIKKIDKGLYPKAFCKIIPDYLTGDPEQSNLQESAGNWNWKEKPLLGIWMQMVTGQKI